ncbi:MAG: CHAT domain-containing protein, partial [Cyanobacteria bacterium P01_F01_bin.3]
MVTIYRLNVYKVEQTCLFELSWGQGQRKTAKLPYPSALTVLYQSWQRDYLGYYKSELRSRVGVAGQVISQVNWHSQLGQSEAKLLSEFHRWLRREPLHDIRDQLIQARQTHDSITLFLTCEPIEVARLPWEAWELSAEASGRAPIRIARCPANIRSSTVEPPNRQDKPRVLVIWGDDTNLDMNRDRNTLTEFNALLDITSIGWQPGCDTLTLKQDICKTVANKDGWDMLFFFGHSNEAKVVGGEIAIAPNATLSLQDLTPYLKTAQSKGLQFALFNSCSGIDIADSLIDLGLNQVVIMREPIHNQVAQTFLSHFLHQLAKWCDVHDALLKACQSLKAENHLTYPSAYLIPSLFHHPSAPLFQLEPQGWLTKIQHWLPTRRQAAALGVLALLSVLPPVQQRLLSGRLLAQSIYRQVTMQIPKSSPPVTLIQVDEASIR